MPRRPLHKMPGLGLFPNAFLGASLAARTAEMWWGSAKVIRTRVGQLATAKFPLSQKDQQEIVRMGAEKVAAIQEAAMAAGIHIARNAGKAATPASALALSQAMLKPFRTRVKANVRRLTGKS